MSRDDIHDECGFDWWAHSGGHCPGESEPHDVEVERELIRQANERHSSWEQERRLDWFIGFGLLALLLAGFYFNKILAVWK